MDFGQNNKKIGVNNLITIAIAAVSLIFYCFASYITMSVKAFGQSQSQGAGFFSDLFFEDGYILITLVGIITILVAAAIIVTAVLNMKKENLICTYAGAVAGIISLICAMIKAGDLEERMDAAMSGGNMFGSVEYSVGAGWGLWLAVIGLVACAAVARFIPEKESEFTSALPQYRSVAAAIIFSILTCGIYSIYWFVKLTDETNYATGEYGTSGGTAFLLSLVTCGIYSWFWMYKQGEKLDRLAIKKGQFPTSRSVVYLLLGLFGFGIVSYALMQDSLNKLA